MATSCIRYNRGAEGRYPEPAPRSHCTRWPKCLTDENKNTSSSTLNCRALRIPLSNQRAGSCDERSPERIRSEKDDDSVGPGRCPFLRADEGRIPGNEE